MKHRVGTLIVACAVLCSGSAGQDSTLYSFIDPMVAEYYIFYSDHTFAHYSQSLGKFYCGRGTWEDDRGTRTTLFGLRDPTMTMADTGWNLLGTTGALAQPVNYEVGPGQHSFKVKKDRLVFNDYRYSLWERIRGEKQGYLVRQP